MEFSIKEFIKSNKSTFEEVQDSYKRTSSIEAHGEYTILNYEKILSSMVDYIDGYMKYKEDDDDERFRNKIESSTIGFYNRMFSDTETYRKTIALSEFPDINREFLRLTKELQTKLDELRNCVDVESARLMHITEKQYKKLSKVIQDDMQIYLWLGSTHPIRAEIRTAFNDPATPVMHRKGLR